MLCKGRTIRYLRGGGLGKYQKKIRVFYDNWKKFMSSPPPRRTFRKNFLGHLKKNIVQRNVVEKKILASNWGTKKNSSTEKLPNPPPQKSNGPSLN